jgi:hypothetical protein
MDSSQSQANASSTAGECDPGDETANVADHVIFTNSKTGEMVVVNELLSYISFYRGKSTVDSVRKAVSSFFTATEINRSKKLLISKFSELLVSSHFCTDRRNTNTRPASGVEFDDIMGIFEIVDNGNHLDNVKFVPLNLERVPRFGPEELSFGSVSVLEKQAVLEAGVGGVTARVDSLEIAAVDSAAKLQDVVDKLDTLNLHVSTHQCSGSAVQGISDKLDALCSKDTMQPIAPSLVDDLQHRMDDITSKLETMSASILNLAQHQSYASVLSSLSSQSQHLSQQRSQQQVQVPGTATPSAVRQFDRSLNIVVFGVDENKDVHVWRQKVFDVLRFCAGRPIAIADMFRIGGRYAAGKVRPVLVKLTSAWDHRTVLSSSSYKMSQYPGKIFIAADEPLETRRKHMLGRLKRRAEHDGKVVSIVDGCLYVNGSVVFSLSDGKVVESGMADS